MRKLQRMIFLFSIFFILFVREVAADTNENWADMPEEIQSDFYRSFIAMQFVKYFHKGILFIFYVMLSTVVCAETITEQCGKTIIYVKMTNIDEIHERQFFVYTGKEKDFYINQ